MQCLAGERHGLGEADGEREIEAFVEERCDELIGAWQQHFGG